MISSNVKQLQEMYLNGDTVPAISKALRVPEDEIYKFLPTGQLLLAYQSVITARRKLKYMQQETAIAVEHAQALRADNVRCSSALDATDASIKSHTLTLKNLRSAKKNLTAQLDEINKLTAVMDEKSNTLLASIVDIEEELTDSTAEKEKVEIAAAKERDRILKEKAIQKEAEQMAQEAIIHAATKAAKGIIAESIAKQLEREDGQR